MPGQQQGREALKLAVIAMINDSQKIIGAHGEFGRYIPFYDDGYGPLFVHQDSLGNFSRVTSIIRARTWEDAYSIWEDEFAPEADETIEEIKKEYDFRRECVKIIHPLKDGEIDKSATKDAELADYEAAGGKLRDGQLVKWETRETPQEDSWSENELFQEAFGLRPNGPRKGDTRNHGIYSKDLNGDRLDKLTPKLAKQLGITVIIRDFEDNDELAFVPTLPLL